MNTNEIIEFYLDNDVLVSPEVIKELDSNPLPISTQFIVLNKDTLNLANAKTQIHVEEFEKAIVLKEKRKDTKLYDKFTEYLNTAQTSHTIQKSVQIEIKKQEIHHIQTQTLQKTQQNFQIQSASAHIEIKKEVKIGEDEPVPITPQVETVIIDKKITQTTSKEIPAVAPSDFSSYIFTPEKEQFMKDNKIKIVSNYTSKSKKWQVSDFVGLYISRYRELEKILRSRTELNGLTSISRIAQKKERENVAFIGVVYEKAITKSGNILFTIEDPTGSIKVVVNKTKEQLFRLAEEIQLDETIGITGTWDQICFASNILLPEIPLTKELKKSPEDGLMLIISDTQVGGKLFLDKEFEKLLAWLNGEIGNEKQKETASRIKYIFIAGDLVEGVGIYPNQEYDLSILDVKDQYIELAKMLRRIPSHIPIIVCPGNHDVGRLSEPQLPLSKEYAWPILSMPNLISLSNPSMINVYAHPEQGFDGLDVMFYHGGSLIYYSENIMSVRKSGGQKRPDMIMKYWLQRRHLAPTHSATLYIPDSRKDPLLIDKVPDILITGHIHRSSVSSYKNVTCFNASCWVAKSPEQERRGLEPQPGRAFIVDMRTREVKVMNFLSKEDQEKENETKSMDNPASV